MSTPTPVVLPSVLTPSLAGRVALITGASSGIGEATAYLFAAAGAKLVLNGRDKTRLQAVADRITKKGGQVVTQIGSVAEEATHIALVDLALKTYGGLHVVFNNAGVFPFGPITSTSAADVNNVVDTNIKGIVYALKHQLPALAKSATKDNWGSIINNSSTVGTRPFAGGLVYSATKAAVDSLTKGAAIEGAPLFVRVNAVSPGPTGTPGALELFDKLPQPAPGKEAPKLTLVPGLATSEEVGQFVTFVSANNTGRFFNGAILLLDGGAERC